jgi:hypothetical protein
MYVLSYRNQNIGKILGFKVFICTSKAVRKKMDSKACCIFLCVMKGKTSFINGLTNKLTNMPPRRRSPIQNGTVVMQGEI